MKIVVLIFAASLFAACSSAKKQPEATPQPSFNAPAPVLHDTSQNAQKDFEVVKTATCESGKDKRTLEVHKKPTGCELSYTKFGKGKVVSSGKHGTKHCEDSLDKITKKLEAQKFTCSPS